MITKFNLADDLPLHKAPELCNMVIVVRSVFHEGNQYYLHVFLDEYDRIDVSEGTVVNKSDGSC